MKKILIFLLAAICAFCAVGCVDSPSDNDNTDNPPDNATVREYKPLVSYTDFGLDKVSESMKDYVFYSSGNDAVTYVANALWDQFGIANGGYVGARGGGSAWLYWDTVKFSWYAGGNYREGARNTLRDYPQRADGYLWSWGNSETWGGAGYNQNDPSYTPVYHFDQIFNYINAVREICVWEHSTDFLSAVDSNTNQTEIDVDGVHYSYDDASKGKTVLQKTEKAFEYAFNTLGGKDGLIVIDNGANTAEFGSASSNYWDNLCFGYKDPYEGALFLGSVAAMGDIYRMLGDETKSAQADTLLITARAEYDKTYWDSQKGRYISGISESGKKVDYGFTFLNTEALYYGAGNADKAEKILSWIDGKRTVEGDTVTGKDILDTWNIAPMVNTIPVESVKELNEDGSRYVTWWHGPSGINVFTNSKFGLHCENGGTIFYTAFFEQMSRIKYGYKQDALQRWITIADEYAVDKLLRDPYNQYGSQWVLGVIGEFPESGLLPVSYVRGFMGVNAQYDGLHIEPNIPDEYNDMGAKNVYYAGKNWNICIKKNSEITLRSTDKVNAQFPLVFSDFAGKGSYTVTVTDANGTVTQPTPQKTADGKFAVQLSTNGNCSVKIA